MTVCYPMGKERCQKMTSGRAGNSSANSNISPFSHFFNLSFSLFFRTNTQLVLSPFTLSDYRTTRWLSSVLGFGGGIRVLVHQLKSLTCTILGSLGDVLEAVELWVEAAMPPGGGGGAALIYKNVLTERP